MSTVVLNPLTILSDGYCKTVGVTDDNRLKVDIEYEPHTHNGLEQILQDILVGLDGYYPYNTGYEKDLSHDTSIYAILQALDGYDGSGSELTNAIQTILNELDGYYLYTTGSEKDADHDAAIGHILEALDGYGDCCDNNDDDIDALNNAVQTIINEIDGYVHASEKGAVNGVATLDSGGKIPAGQIPAVSLPEVHVVYDDTARLALDVQEGDEAIQTSDGYHWIYDGSTWYVRPVNSHGADHHAGGADPINVQDLGSGGAPGGYILTADGSGGWSVVQNSGGSSMTNITHQMAFVQTGASSSNYWFDYYADNIPSDDTHGIMPWKSKLIGISFTNQYSGVDGSVKVYAAAEGDAASPTTKMLEWLLTNVRVARKTNFSPDIIFDAGDKVGVFWSDRGTNPDNSVIILYFQATSDAVNEESSENYSGDFSLSSGTSD